MNPEQITPLQNFIHHIPLASTVLATCFAVVLFRRWSKRGGLHLFWWGLGFVTFALGTLTEGTTTLIGWNPFVFKVWYIAGAFLGGWPLAQGSIYLLMNRRFAHASAIIVTVIIVIGSVFVILSPLDASVASTRLHGGVLVWSKVRLLSPFINLYALVFLMGGAIYSAWMYRKKDRLRPRYLGNILIAIGALLPGIGGTMTRAGYVEGLYITEFCAIILIFAGYKMCISTRPAEKDAPGPDLAAAPAPLESKARA
jgi:hypothetical protein